MPPREEGLEEKDNIWQVLTMDRSSVVVCVLTERQIFSSLAQPHSITHIISYTRNSSTFWRQGVYSTGTEDHPGKKLSHHFFLDRIRNSEFIKKC